MKYTLTPEHGTTGRLVVTQSARIYNANLDRLEMIASYPADPKLNMDYSDVE